jgi:uncharacterized protein YndB with AHSA1/START domain
MEWGTEVRGTYEVVAPPQLIVMCWDFEHDNVPVPGASSPATCGYVQAGPTALTSRCTSSSTPGPRLRSLRRRGQPFWAG